MLQQLFIGKSVYLQGAVSTGGPRVEESLEVVSRDLLDIIIRGGEAKSS